VGKLNLDPSVSFLIMPDSTLPTESLPPPEPFGQFGPGVGDQIGPYRLLGVLGSGGFGVVFEAEQREPVRRRVALKVIKPGMDSASVIARFEAERQALAVMDHPCIAKIFDGGVTGPDQGSRPYFVMELVKGVPITEHCDTQRLTIDERCALFARVCDAVQHAHMKGVIHRDLKPSNILIGYDEHGEGHPKVIDFGVAKALNQRLTEATIFTERGQLIGTPEYMSPEQAEMSGQDIDTRADVYSLGIVLYELLTGVLPFDSGSLREAAFGEIQRIIREVDPPKPSTRLSTATSTTADEARITKARRVDARHLTGVLRRDLDWVVLKCIEKSRERRYTTPNALAEDLRRFLDSEPVHAGPPSVTYRAQKFVRRNRGVLTAGFAIALVLCLGLVGTLIGLVWALQERADAQQQTRIAVEAKQGEAAMRADAEAAFNRAIDAEEEANGRSAELADALGSILQLASSLTAEGRAAEAEPFAREALSGLREVYGDDRPLLLMAMKTLGAVLASQGKYAEAQLYLEPSLEGYRLVLGSEHPDTMVVMVELGQLLQMQGRLLEAEPILREAAEVSRRVLGTDHPSTLNALDSLGAIAFQAGKLDEAEALWRSVVAKRQRIMGDSAPVTISARVNLASVLATRGQHQAARNELQSAFETIENDTSRYPASMRITVLANLANSHIELEEWRDAERRLMEASGGSRWVLGGDHPETLHIQAQIGYVFANTNREAEAILVYEEVVSRLARVLGADHPDVLQTQTNWAVALALAGETDRAVDVYQSVLARWERVLGPEHPQAARVREQLQRLVD
jgi:eukaryotic-like serine/threonine-protein kinase